MPTLPFAAEGSGWASGISRRLLADVDLTGRDALTDFFLLDPARIDHRVEVVLGDRDRLQEGRVHGVAAGALELHGARDVGELGALGELHGDLAGGLAELTGILPDRDGRGPERHAVQRRM